MRGVLGIRHVVCQLGGLISGRVALVGIADGLDGAGHDRSTVKSAGIAVLYTNPEGLGKGIVTEGI